jgi:membrane-associated phospholipid phosphatase
MNIEKCIDYLGYNGPYLLTFLTILILLWHKLFTLVAFFTIGYGFNSLINFLIKGIVKEPRPCEDKCLHTLQRITGSRISVDKYGMPSGHSQIAFYSTIFIWFSLKQVWLTLFYLIISLNTLRQRIKYKNHTIKQVIAGSLVGSIVGYIAYYLSQKNLMGSLKMRADDFSRIR